MTQERYKLVRNESEGTIRLESNGEKIWEPDGAWSKKDGDFLEAILDDADFGQPQKDALRALLGLIPERVEERTDSS